VGLKIDMRRIMVVKVSIRTTWSRVGTLNTFLKELDTFD
jgi:hypothetical protein